MKLFRELQKQREKERARYVQDLISLKAELMSLKNDTQLPSDLCRKRKRPRLDEEFGDSHSMVIILFINYYINLL